MTNYDERRLWIGNLDTRISEFQLLKIVQKCGKIEKFDMLFHKAGPLCGQSRGYAFVTYETLKSAQDALDKLNGRKVGTKTMVVRLSKNFDYDELDRSGARASLGISALNGGVNSASGSGSAAANAKRINTQSTIHAIEAKLRALENNSSELVINQSGAAEPPLIHRYQFNMQGRNEPSDRGGRGGRSIKSRYTSGPYGRRGGGSRR